MSKTVVGLDLETSAVDINRGAVPIQLGIALDDRMASFDIGWPGFVDTTDLDFKLKEAVAYVWDEQSQQVHGIDREYITTLPVRAPEIAQAAVNTLDDWEIGHRQKSIIVGWNVAGFDLPFVRKYMPALADRVSYRTIDLNAVCFAIGDARLYSPTGERWTYRKVKEFAKSVAEAQIMVGYGVEPQWHDAGYDAWASVLAYRSLCRIMRTGLGVL